MLEVTPVAAEVIKELVTDSPTQNGTAPDNNTGLRFALHDEGDDNQASLELSVSEPTPGDEVIAAESGARVIMEPAAARFLDDKVLDIREDANGQPAFALSRQG